ncbi:MULTISPECIES: UxaA family hydrolase [unclassified Aureimonas]|uniref:UxaA family hydrolase n=1 Tax=unclassified Aureimonas TaxID=2615206 RepID=UPI0006F26B7B|nr:MULTISPECIES: altronate dehydratase family protein [unclassified Aureimonas]KQT52454.1 galactonate dehydratase [Aureimonas sp. Leaf427]KQT77645.1 galactonate dehydratase [Aureimonas sp. Leaf460]
MLDSPAGPSPLIRLHAEDNVAIARLALDPMTTPLPGGTILKDRVPRGHKMALEGIAEGRPVVKYGQVIGFASRAIGPGEHVHTHNLAMADLDLFHEFCVDAREPDYVPEAGRATFLGYRRPDGRVGTRNYLAIVSSVNCSATVSKAIAAHFSPATGRLDAFENVDGIVPITHGGGCAVNMQGEGYLYLTRVLSGYATHPNVGAVLMIGLGCETNQIPALLARHGLSEGPNFRTMTIQAMGGTRATIEAGIEAVRQMLPALDAARRTPQSAAHITLALECGGSDGYSGISANPALGYASDLLVRHGGTAVLAETPEIYGAEHLLTRRAATPAVAQKLLDRIDWWRDYAARGKAELNNNPSHGNKAGGLTTILEKSLGAVAKGGASRLNAVYEYAEPITETGFVFMDTPGYDPVAVTGQVAGGCNMICFTTGRGSVSGFKPAPSLKLATNTPMYEHMKDDMDLDCGPVVTGEETIEEAGRRIFAAILAAASGEPTKSEMFDYGDNEFVPWQVGAVM